MVEPYQVAAIQTDVLAVESRDDIKKNLKRAEELTGMACALGATEFPVKLACFPEFFLQGFNLSKTCPTTKTVKYFTKNLTIDIPGEETDRLSKKCIENDVYIAGVLLTRDPHWDDRFFNVTIIIDPNGKIVHKYTKHNNITNQVDVTMTPHDMWDEWIKVYGDSLEALFPVTETPIGKLAACPCYDGVFPEVVRAFAVQGAEIILKPTAWADPWMSNVEDNWEISNRARAMDNVAYVVAPNDGGCISPTLPRVGSAPGVSLIIDYRGKVLAIARYPGETIITATINIDQLRKHRTRNKWYNLVPCLRNELYQKIYEKPMWPKNRFLEALPEPR